MDKSLFPIKKIISGAVASALVYAAHRWLSLNLGTHETANGVELVVGWIAAYAVKDARVKAVADEVDGELHKLEASQFVDMIEHAVAENVPQILADHGIIVKDDPGAVPPA